jgi:putative transposase
MSHYRRANTKGATYFFTVVTYRRQPLLCDTKVRDASRKAIESVRLNRPFIIDAWVLLPDHLHCTWTLPSDDVDYAIRWRLIKRSVSLTCVMDYKRLEWMRA